MLATRTFSFFVFLFAILAAASARLVPSHTKTSSAAPTQTTPASQCNTGPIQCCNSVQPASSSEASSLLGLLGIVLGDLDLDVGLDCNPISILGLGGSECDASAVCCENNNFNGLIAIGCTPINIGL